MRLQTNYSGAGQVSTIISPDPTFKHFQTLDRVFRHDVLGDKKMAWYADHFTEDVAMFNVRHLVADPLLYWTNENTEQRDPNDPINGQWASEDVAAWFTDDEEVSHAYVVKFQAGGVEHRLTIRPFSASIDDTFEVWNEYVDQGVRGALAQFHGTFEKLFAIEHYTL